MVKVLQISSEVNIGSVGKIAEQLGEEILKQKWESYIAYGRDGLPSTSQIFKIGNKLDKIRHGIYTRITDRHGFASKKATKSLIKKIDLIKPDIIHLHHLHGYFINIEILSEYLAQIETPIVWTFHDCWSFTGHCAHYEFIGCKKWLTQCQKCPQKGEYPKSLFRDSSYQNYIDKKRLFNAMPNLTIVSVSNWLQGEVAKSFLKGHTTRTIQNGIDLAKFVAGSKKNIDNIKKKYNVENKFIILGVANPWTRKKGLDYFLELSDRLSSDFRIVLVGLKKRQIERVRHRIVGLERTKNVEELAQLYSAADVFLNLTLENSFPTTNLEALACGTPIITFRSGGSPEALDENTGIVVEKGDCYGIENAIYQIQKKGSKHYQDLCRQRAELYFDKRKCFSKYIELYKEILG